MERTLPLGVDIGATRLRIVCTKRLQGVRRVVSVATRDLEPGSSTSGIIPDIDGLGAMINDAWRELATRERRCVLAVGLPDAQLHGVELPSVRAHGRNRIALLEARRYLRDYPYKDALVRLHPLKERESQFALGIVRGETLRSRLDALKSSSLRVVAVDHESLALQRSLPDYDAILDIGFERSSLHAFGRALPVTLPIPYGGERISYAIERELAIDAPCAEKRKRVHGTSGAGETARDALIADVVALMRTIDPRGKHLDRIALVGNGARLKNLAPDLERACRRRVEVAASAILSGDAYPRDVFLGAAPDWNLAAGLSLWTTGAA